MTLLLGGQSMSFWKKKERAVICIFLKILCDTMYFFIWQNKDPMGGQIWAKKNFALIMYYLE